MSTKVKIGDGLFKKTKYLYVYPVIERTHILDDFDNGVARADVILDLMRTGDKTTIEGQSSLANGPGRFVNSVKLQAVLLDDKLDNISYLLEKNTWEEGKFVPKHEISIGLTRVLQTDSGPVVTDKLVPQIEWTHYDAKEQVTTMNAVVEALATDFKKTVYISNAEMVSLKKVTSIDSSRIAPKSSLSDVLSRKAPEIAVIYKSIYENMSEVEKLDSSHERAANHEILARRIDDIVDGYLRLVDNPDITNSQLLKHRSKVVMERTLEDIQAELTSLNEEALNDFMISLKLLETDKGLRQ